ncbi:MAG TPA: serine/threonine-protein kinase, partial [Acidimicrobiales bacterium]
MIPGYRSFELLGRGGSADVYRAWEDSLHRYVAVKVLRPGAPGDERWRTRFEREKALHAQLAGRGLAVVPVFRADVTSDGRPYLVMQLYDGSVHDWIVAEGTTFTDAQAVAVLRPVAEAVQGAHDLDIVHGDIKPENILLSEGGPALGDFGVARAVSSPRSGSKGPGASLPDRRLTLRHAAPEVLDGEPPTRASDVWSLGSTLYRMLAPACAFEPRSGESLDDFRHRVRFDPPPPIMRQLQDGVWELIEAAMAKDPASRPDARDLRRSLDAIARVQLPTTAPTLTRGATVVPPPADAPPLPPGTGATVDPEPPPVEPLPVEALPGPVPAADAAIADAAVTATGGPGPADGGSASATTADPAPEVAGPPWPNPSPFAARHDAPLAPPPTVRGGRRSYGPPAPPAGPRRVPSPV